MSLHVISWVMPKATAPTFPLNGLFGLVKPSGPTSMSLLEMLKPLLFESRLFVGDEDARLKAIAARKGAGSQKKGKGRGRGRAKDLVKVGQGGTLDPLADGVLVVGLNKGTKSLNAFLGCTKEYHTTALLGCETDSYDSQGARVRIAPFAHVTREKIESVLDRFRGPISQLPPVYSALKMDGKPLYEYAREGRALPRPIEARNVTVHSLELVGWREATSPGVEGHDYKWPEKTLDDNELAAMANVKKLVEQAGLASADSPIPLIASEAPNPPVIVSDPRPPIFMLKMVVSSGTYVRSIVHDIAQALGSAAHVVTLTRTRQGSFALGSDYLSPWNPDTTKDDQAERQHGDCIPWSVFERAIEKRARGDEAVEGTNEEWEEAILAKWRDATATISSLDVVPITASDNIS